MRPGLTADEARQTFCPFVRPEYLNSPPFGNHPACIAATCAAWRWADPALTNEPEHVRRPMADQRKGFCGLAGPINTVVDWEGR